MNRQSSEPTTSPLPAPSRKWRRIVKRLAIAGMILVLLSALLMVGGWFYLRSENFNRFVAEQIKNKLRQSGLRGEIGGFEFSFDDQTARLRDFQVFNQETGQLIATIKRVEISVNIRDLYAPRASREIELKKIGIEGLELKIEIDKDGRTNLDGVHKPPPTSRRITFDATKFLATVNGGTIRFNDLKHRLDAELSNLEVTAQPRPEDPQLIELQLKSTGSRAGFEGRDSKIAGFDLDARISGSGAQIEQLKVISDLTELTARGKIHEWRKFKSSFDYDSRVKLDEVSRLFAPDFKMKGFARSSGRFDGEGPRISVKGRARADEMSFYDTKLHGVELPQIVFEGQGEQFSFTANQARAQSAGFDEVQVKEIAIGNVKGEIKDKRTRVSAPVATATSIEWPESLLSDLSLSGLKADFSDRHFEVTADALLKSGTISRVPFKDVTARATFDQQALDLTEIKAGAFGGSAAAEFNLPLARGNAARVKGSFADIETAGLLSIFVAKNVPLTGKVNGEIELSWIGANPQTINGTIKSRFDGKTAQTTDLIPLTGGATIDVQNGVFNFENAQLTTDASKATVTGQLSTDGDSDLKVKLTSTQAEQLVQIARSFEAAQIYLTEYEPQILGDLKFDGSLRGPIEKPAIEGDLSIATAGLRDALLGAVSGHLQVSPAELKVEKGLISASNGGSVKFDLFTPLDQKAETGWLNADFKGMDLETVLAAAGAPSAQQFINGNLTGEAYLTGLPGSPNGRVLVNLIDGKIADRPAQVASAVLKFDGKVAALETLDLQLPQSSLRASGEINLKDYTFDARGDAHQISLDDLAKAFATEGEQQKIQIEGTADVDFLMGGKVLTGKKTELDWEKLQVNVIAEGKGVKINGRNAGELRFAARTSPGGRVDFGLRTDILAAAKSKNPDERPEVVFGNIELRKPGRPVTIESNLNNQNLSPILELFAPELVSTVTGNVTGKLTLEGPTVEENGNSTYRRLRGGLTLTETSIEVANVPVKVETPFTATMENMQIKVSRTRFIGQGLDLAFGGTLGLEGESAMDFSLNGAINLTQLPPPTPDLLLGGTVAIDARLTGTAEKPDLQGRIDVLDLSLSSGDLPFFVTEGNANITLAGDQITLNNFKASANDGTLEATGVLKLKELRPNEWRYNIKADNAAFDYQDVRANISGDLTLNGTRQGQTLFGTIAIPQAEYSPGIDLDNLLGGGSTNLFPSGFDSSGGFTQPASIPPVSLNIRIEARDSLIVRSEQINAVGSAVVTLTGTLNDPDLTGRIETDGGSVRFRGQRYEISVGSLDLPARSGTPLLNLLAESQFSGYRVTIGFVGPIDGIDLTLRSEPQLVRDEILALITTGRTEPGTLTSRDPLLTGVGAAASLLSSGFISKPTEQLLGLSRFQIDPVIRPNANPAARLTVGQQLARNLYLSYSTNLATEQDQTALAEYTFTNRFSALATYTQGGSSTRQGLNEGVFTIELRGRRRFSLGFTPSSPPATSAGATGAPGATTARDSHPALPSAQVTVNKTRELDLGNKKLRELLPVMTQGFSRSLARLGERRLREYLQENGYFFAEVKYRCEPVNCSGDNLRVFYDVEPGMVYDLKEIRISGTELIKLRDVKAELQSQVASQVGGIPFLKDLPLIGGYVRGLTSNERLRNDEQIIQRKLLDIGYRGARVNSRLAVKPDNDEMLVIFNVEEGVQSEIAGVNLRGNAIVPVNQLREAVPIQAGEAFSYSRTRAGIQQIKRLYAEMGFLDASAELELVDLDENSVVLIYQIDEGPRAVVSEIEINGLTKTGQGWVRRYLDFKPGEVLTPEKIRRTQQDLYSTNAFREVTIRSESIGGGDGSPHRVSLNLTEAKPLLFVYGLGYSTDDGVRGSIEIANTNLGGSLDSLSLRMRASRREQFSQLAFTDLRPFSWRLPTTISVFYNRSSNLRPFVRRRVINEKGDVADSEEGRDFGLQRFAAFIQTERKLNQRTSLRFRYNLERANLFGIDPEAFQETEVTRNERAIRLGMFSAGVTRDTRDNVLNPTTGQLISADHSIAASIFGGNESFNKFFGTYQAYRTLDSGFPLLGNSTLAFSARIGLAAVFRDADRDGDGVISESEQRLPISERFFSGGATTLRGFRFETAGPQDIIEPRPEKNCLLPGRPCDLPTLVPVGGDALAIFNFELRYPLTPRLRLVPFYDLGNVFRRVTDFRFSNMTNTVGLGLRINTPLGPVGVDYGFLLDPPAYLTTSGAVLRQPRGAIHIRLGQSF